MARGKYAKPSKYPFVTYFFEELFFPLLIQTVVILVVVKLLFFLVIVPTGSMIPTIDEGSLLFAMRVYNIPESVDRGDVLVFYSDELNTTLIKRLIGLPGDTVEIDHQGNVTINGEPYPERYVVNQASYKSGTYYVPENCYFFMGDNRSGSFDARDWRNPYIAQEDIRGRAVFTLWPLSNFGVLK